MAQIVRGTSGDDEITTEGGDGPNEDVRALGGDDLIINLGGSDTFNGGSGNDTLYTPLDNDLFPQFEPFSFAVEFNLLTGIHGRADSTIGQDKLISIENYLFTGNFHVIASGDKKNNVFITDTGDDILSGNGGRDFLASGAGDDLLNGGTGRDVLFGGGGRDVFEFSSIKDSSARAKKADKILDFKQGKDKIDLSAIDDFDFIAPGNVGADVGPEVTYTQIDVPKNKDWTDVQVDRDGDGDAEMVIRLKGLIDLTADDFIL
ncbi:hypothetical protein HCZ30_10755 [Marivivens donghaensis]|uniref:Peptidase M10 serralysin C-terminal domain-containing protein n=1 Tax=Marivivens donghaensis TaxID=1699413 RepID=A0ABX0VXS8_9RHOB|nr:M10 family metallopeptidase C-terminal domain-containing protein [Marivivens donghaensis]NIY72908.1 hypothetical protein [Marivivens donghaensis]